MGTYLALNEDAGAAYTTNPLNPSIFGGVWAGTARESLDLAPSTSGGKKFTISTAGLILPTFISDPVSGDWHLSFWIQLYDVGTSVFDPDPWTRQILSPNRPWSGATATGDIAVRVNSLGTLQLYQDGTGGSASAWTSLGSDGAPHHVAYDCDAGTGMTITVDGRAMSGGEILDITPTRWKALSTFLHYFGGDSYDLTNLDTTIDSEAVGIGHYTQLAGRGYGSALHLASRFGSVTEGATWDTPTQRIAWALAQAGVTAGTIDATSTMLRGVRGSDLPAEHIRKVAASDGGFFWIDSDGLGRYRSPLSGGIDAEFKDDAVGLGYQGIEPVRDRSRRITAARATVETTPIAGYDTGRTPLRELEFEVLNLLPLDAYARCVAVVDERKDVGTVYPALSFQPDRDNRWVTALTLDLGQWVRVKRTPLHITPAINVATRVEGIRHSCGQHLSTWTTTLSLGVPTTTEFFLLDTSLLGTGRLA